MSAMGNFSLISQEFVIRSDKNVEIEMAKATANLAKMARIDAGMIIMVKRTAIPGPGLLTKTKRM